MNRSHSTDLILAAISVEFARSFAALGFISCCIWASTDLPCFIGKPNWNSNLLSCHALLLSSTFFCAFAAMFSHWTRYNAVSYHPNDMHLLRVAHYIWRIGALVFAFMGVYAGVKHHNQLSMAHGTSYHSWIGFVALFCLSYFAFIDICRNLYTLFIYLQIMRPIESLLTSIPLQFFFRFHNSFFGNIFLLSMLSALETGIQQYLNTNEQCIDGQSSQGYQLGNVMGLCVFITFLSALMAISYRRSVAISLMCHGLHTLNETIIPQVTQSDIDGLIGIEPNLFGNLSGEHEVETRHVLRA